MDQVSRPFQVVLAAALLFAVLWFIALRPKPESGSRSAPPSPAVAQPAAPRQPGNSLPNGMGRAVTKADQAKNQANGSARARQQAAGNPTSPGTATNPAPLTKPAPGARAPTPTKPSTGARPRGRARGGPSPAAVTSALQRGKVVVLLFWNPRGSDDRVVRDELRRVSTHRGRVMVVAAPISSVSGYGAVTQGIQVLQSPTVLVIDRRRRARMLAGFTDAAEVGQAVTEALRVR